MANDKTVDVTIAINVNLHWNSNRNEVEITTTGHTIVLLPELSNKQFTNYQFKGETRRRDLFHKDTTMTSGSGGSGALTDQRNTQPAPNINIFEKDTNLSWVFLQQQQEQPPKIVLFFGSLQSYDQDAGNQIASLTLNQIGKEIRFKKIAALIEHNTAICECFLRNFNDGQKAFKINGIKVPSRDSNGVERKNEKNEVIYEDSDAYSVIIDAIKDWIQLVQTNPLSRGELSQQLSGIISSISRQLAKLKDPLIKLDNMTATYNGNSVDYLTVFERFAQLAEIRNHMELFLESFQGDSSSLVQLPEFDLIANDGKGLVSRESRMPIAMTANVELVNFQFIFPAFIQ